MRLVMVYMVFLYTVLVYMVFLYTVLVYIVLFHMVALYRVSLFMVLLEMVLLYRVLLYTVSLFGAVAKDDADDQDQQSLRNIRYCILNWLASSSWINSWIFVSFSLKSTCIDNSHKHGKCLATNDWLYAWLMLAWPLDWHIDWFSRF